MTELSKTNAPEKHVVYQVFTRLFGNTNATNKPWGTLEENGIGKFNDFTDKALSEIKQLGVSHIWYTGVPHHALVRDYSEFGIASDHPSVVKGRAGSPYAVKDYYNVNPDLAVDPANRLEEFKALIERSHRNGLRVIIDIVPNHVARRYQGLTNPEGVEDFGASDDVSIEYHRDNNFYYIPDEAFKVPEAENGYLPLGGEAHPNLESPYEEFPAKWTGNGSRLAQPQFDDWYETVKVNYGVRPDGSKDFDELPAGFERRDHTAHFEFWQGKSVPDSWVKFRDIALYWLELGVDGFRYDMAEMVPVEFWSYMNSSIKQVNPDAFLMAEVYQPDLYRDYIHLGKMDYLYDKVDLYDTLKLVMQGSGSTDAIVAVQQQLMDIEHHMLHFLDNHDEQRLASPEFAGNANKGKPAMLVSTTLSSSPTMVYFGQEVGEAGKDDAGFGLNSRTTIFDYFGVPSHQRWMNGGEFDGGLLADPERDLRDFYQRLLTFSLNSPAMLGEYQEIHGYNREHSDSYNDQLFCFSRFDEQQKLLIVANFADKDQGRVQVKLPATLVDHWQLTDGEYLLTEQLYGQETIKLSVSNGEGEIHLMLLPLAAMIFLLD
ncbi:alpha-amylase family protein [Photobacterium sp. SDRW27]|uniref:alpha-amylase family protein n=1 Tax=Photobacterium obscurum TaxID=2829490 RepID=UPI0022436556|nr:alpha-amylase family protein [Photobacterium obscurum]MCW8328635.1 alpha-amylase family protein [Photobacterium obscurum]